jgi:hypothetical protein
MELREVHHENLTNHPTLAKTRNIQLEMVAIQARLRDGTLDPKVAKLALKAGKLELRALDIELRAKRRVTTAPKRTMLAPLNFRSDRIAGKEN